jgi:hypothetical protein
MHFIARKFNDVEEFRGMIFEGKEILKTLGMIATAEDGLIGWNCIMGDASIQMVPKEFFAEQLEEDEIIVGFR